MRAGSLVPTTRRAVHRALAGPGWPGAASWLALGARRRSRSRTPHRGTGTGTRRRCTAPRTPGECTSRRRRRSARGSANAGSTVRGSVNDAAPPSGTAAAGPIRVPATGGAGASVVGGGVLGGREPGTAVPGGGVLGEPVPGTAVPGAGEAVLWVGALGPSRASSPPVTSRQRGTRRGGARGDGGRHGVARARGDQAADERHEPARDDGASSAHAAQAVRARRARRSSSAQERRVPWTVRARGTRRGRTGAPAAPRSGTRAHTWRSLRPDGVCARPSGPPTRLPRRGRASGRRGRHARRP
jgi:hypothetical protein